MLGHHRPRRPFDAAEPGFLISSPSSLRIRLCPSGVTLTLRVFRPNPCTRVDNGSECIPRDLDLWAYANDVTLDFSRPGKPTDNGFIEAFNSKFRWNV